MVISVWSTFAIGVGAFLLSWLLPHFVENPPVWFVKIGVFLGCAFIMFGFALWILPDWVSKPRTWPVILLFSGVVACGVGLIFILDQQHSTVTPVEEPEAQTLQGDDQTGGAQQEIHNVTSREQSGGITAHTVNLDTKPRRTLTPETKATLLRDLSNDRPVRVMGMNGDSESMSFANEIYDGLKANNYTMLNESAMSHQFFNPPVFGFKISEGEGGAEWWITVGPAK